MGTYIGGAGPPRPPLLQRVTARQWVAVDMAFAFLLLVAGLGHLRYGGPPVPPVGAGSFHYAPTGVLAVLAVLASAPNAVRRLWPIPVLACVAVAVAALTVAGATFSPVPFLAPAVYMVAVRYERRTSLLALGAVEGLLLLALAVAAALRQVGGDVTFNIILVVAVWFVGDSIRVRHAYMGGLADQAAQRQREERERAQRSVAEERLQIARELHDVVAHSLSVIAVQAGVARHVLDTQPEESRKALVAVETTSRAALDELRGMLGVLRRDTAGRPVLQPAPTVADLDRLADQVRAAGVPVDLVVEGRPGPLSPSVELSIFRIVQEALTNVVKHAGPARAWVHVGYEPGVVVVEVVDDGRGATSPLEAHAGGTAGTGSVGHGLVGMRERAAIFGGTLTVGPGPRHGFCVRARLPLGEHAG